jgi:translation initiation factor 2 beta subunit (eIF-2beta)/eIF-5
MGDLIHKAHLASISKDITTEPMSNEEWEKEYGHLRDAKPEPEEIVQELEPEQMKSLIRWALVKLLNRPGWIKGYIQEVMKFLSIDKDEVALVKEEIEQDMSEMLNAFSKKYKIIPQKKHPFFTP